MGLTTGRTQRRRESFFKYWAAVVIFTQVHFLNYAIFGSPIQYRLLFRGQGETRRSQVIEGFNLRISFHSLLLCDCASRLDNLSGFESLLGK